MLIVAKQVMLLCGGSGRGVCRSRGDETPRGADRAVCYGAIRVVFRRRRRLGPRVDGCVSAEGFKDRSVVYRALETLESEKMDLRSKRFCVGQMNEAKGKKDR